jgi:probable phosphomutase (TIGR03848 family)
MEGMTLLYLIRHGETDFIGKRLAGWLPGVHLNPRGRAQAEALAQLLSGVRFAALYASPLERSMETAEPLSRMLGLAVEPRPSLGEVRPGRWQGQPLRSLRRRKLWSVVQNAPSLARFPEGESFVETQARVVGELEELRAMHRKKTIACVSHADVIKLAIAHYLGLPLDMFHRLSVAPASISILSVVDGYARLVRLNDTRATEQAPNE